MVSRGSTPLSSGSNHPGGHKVGPEGRQGDKRQAEGEKVSSYHLPPGKISGAVPQIRPHMLRSDRRELRNSYDKLILWVGGGDM